jgi:hypothetical protein
VNRNMWLMHAFCQRHRHTIRVLKLHKHASDACSSLRAVHTASNQYLAHASKDQWLPMGGTVGSPSDLHRFKHHYLCNLMYATMPQAPEPPRSNKS